MRSIAAPLALLLASTACTTMETTPVSTAVAPDRMVSPILTSPEAVDTLTYAQPQVARVTHVALDLALDFDSKRVGGTAELTVLAAPGAQEIALENRLPCLYLVDSGGAFLPMPTTSPRVTAPEPACRNLGMTSRALCKASSALRLRERSSMAPMALA